MLKSRLASTSEGAGVRSSLPGKVQAPMGSGSGESCLCAARHSPSPRPPPCEATSTALCSSSSARVTPLLPEVT